MVPSPRVSAGMLNSATADADHEEDSQATSRQSNATAGGEPDAEPVAEPAAVVEPLAPPQLLELSGDVTDVHDPAVIADAGAYYLFSTGQGVQVRTSPDLKVWSKAGQVFASKPSWVTTTAPETPNLLWAPEVAFFGDQFHLYYAASSFGSQSSCIGHATRTSLGAGAGWVDQGSAVICTARTDDFNAIDPNPFVDEQGNAWLALGSFWSGIKLIRLDRDGRRDGPDLFALASRSNNAVEAPFLHYHSGYYYLFESVDSCCQGASSTYKIMVGRAGAVTGPFLDAAGDDLANGGGTLILQGGTRYRGPGHNAILSTPAGDYNVYHSYDANSSGVPTLRIAELRWNEDGFPASAGP